MQFLEISEIKSLFKAGKISEAFTACEHRAKLHPNDPGPLKLLGSMHYIRNNLDAAIHHLKRALYLTPEDAELLFNLSICLQEKGDWVEAEKFSTEYTNRHPDDVNGWVNRSEVELNLNKLEKCLMSCDRAISLKADCAEALNSRGNALVRLGRLSEALGNYQQVLRFRSDFVPALLNAGNVFCQLGQYEKALISYKDATTRRPEFAEAWSGQGNALNKIGLHNEALDCHERAVTLEPKLAAAWSNRGVALNDLRLHEEAFNSHERAINIKPNFPEAWVNRGNTLNDMRRFEEALASYEKAIELQPDFPEAWSNRGNTLNSLGRHDEALLSYEKALAINPKSIRALGDLVHTQMKVCYWLNLDERFQRLEKETLISDCNIPPLVFLSLFDNPKLQKKCAEIFVQNIPHHEYGLRPLVACGRREKIRLGYFSMDFGEHPVSFLITDLIERHDRKKFEVHGFSFSKSTNSPTHKKLKNSFDQFHQVSHLSELEIANLSRHHEIDIAVDLGGHTLDSRPLIFLYRAAPIQINYLGYPGTWGHSCMDYLIGDKITIPEESKKYFSEKIIFMPNQFQVNPIARPSSKTSVKRNDLELPENSFIFCCFNNNWKITPKTFAIWMRILQKVPGSVLWLYADNSFVPKNLRDEAEKLGIEKERLVFASRVSRENYIAQYSHADLFLDTLPYNAGTTASDALWAGIPVLTLAGSSFAGRMASSLLTAIGLPELIVNSSQEYEELAIKIATDPCRLSELKGRLAAARSSTALFDTPRFVRDLESALITAYDRNHLSLPAEHIYPENRGF